MKLILPTALVILSVILSACAASPAPIPPPEVLEIPPAAGTSPVIATAQPIPTQTSAVVTSMLIPPATETSIPQIIVVVIPASTDSPSVTAGVQNPVSYTVTPGDNGKTFNLRAGDNILLDVDIAYDWNIAVDNSSVLNQRTGIAQIIFDAIRSGSANLTAIGNPGCLNSTPPCMMPSVLLKITVIVQ